MRRDEVRGALGCGAVNDLEVLFVCFSNGGPQYSLCGEKSLLLPEKKSWIFLRTQMALMCAFQ